MTHPDKALVIFSGGQDSTTCLIQAIARYGREQVHTITFQYGQRHAIELERARWIAADLGVRQTVLDLSLMQQITHNALLDTTAAIDNTPCGLGDKSGLTGRFTATPCFCCMPPSTPKGKALPTSSPACAKPIFPATPIAAMCL